MEWGPGSVWQTIVDGKVQFPDLLLQQTGNQVTGLLSANRPYLGVIKDGVIDGDTVRFRIWSSNPNRPPGLPPDQLLGEAVLTMAKGSKAFKGTIIGGAVSGTLIARAGQR